MTRSFEPRSIVTAAGSSRSVVTASVSRSACGGCAGVGHRRATCLATGGMAAADRAPRAHGIHTGEAEEHDGTYLGHPVNVAARLMAAAAGGQIMVSDVTAAVIGGVTGAELIDLGRQRLRGLVDPVGASCVRAEGLAWVEPSLIARDALVGTRHAQLTSGHRPATPEPVRAGASGDEVRRGDSRAPALSATCDAAAGSSARPRSGGPKGFNLIARG